MRASAGIPGGPQYRHLSGAERLVPRDEAEQAATELIRRAVSLGVDPDHIQVTFERVPASGIRRAKCLPVTTVTARDPLSARASAEQTLMAAGVSEAAIEAGFRYILVGPPSGHAAHGALLMHPRNGDLLNDPSASGIRASHFDYAPECRDEISATLDGAGLGHSRTSEALALATKVVATGLLAELCWSDDPNYKAGYVSSRLHGYVRFPNFKPDGAVGGRIFFYDGDLGSVESCIRRLKTDDLLIEGPLTIRRIAPSEVPEALSIP